MNSDEPDFFSFDPPALYPSGPGHRGQETSVEAAAAIAAKCGRLHQMTLAAIRDALAQGLTADEASERLEMDRWSIQPRVSELRAKGLIVDSGLRRRNSTGKRAVVWCMPEYRRSEAA